MSSGEYLAIVLHSARAIIPLIPKCMHTSLLAIWTRIQAVGEDTFCSAEAGPMDSALPMFSDTGFQSSVHHPDSDACRLHSFDTIVSLVRDRGYIVAAILRDPFDRLVSFYINKTVALQSEEWDWIVEGGAATRRVREMTFATFVNTFASHIDGDANDLPRLNVHIKPYYSCWIKPLADSLGPGDDDWLVVSDMQDPASMARLQAVLEGRGLRRAVAMALLNTRTNMTARGMQRVARAAYDLLPAEYPNDMCLQSLRVQELEQRVAQVLSDDYILLRKALR